EEKSETGFRDPYGFTGKELEVDLGIMYFGARWYNPQLGRWLSPDPLYLVSTAKNAEKDQNIYHYAGNNPWKFIDPDGFKKRYFARKLENSRPVLFLKNIYNSFVNSTIDHIRNNGTDLEKVNLHMNLVRSQVLIPPIKPVAPLKHIPKNQTKSNMKKYNQQVKDYKNAMRSYNKKINKIRQITRSRVKGYHLSTGYYTDPKTGAPIAPTTFQDWCASFANWVLKSLRYKISLGRYRSGEKKGQKRLPIRARDWHVWGRRINSPVYGAIAIMKRVGGGHIGFVEGQSADGKYLYITGGNQSSGIGAGNTVNTMRIKKDKPEYFVVPHGVNEKYLPLPVIGN
ncbi:CHAP domain-containing protein, partial [Myxococcota bacterium]|nr:CHAP domain-containing protein [Myxococcota bacterium]